MAAASPWPGHPSLDGFQLASCFSVVWPSQLNGGAHAWMGRFELGVSVLLFPSPSLSTRPAPYVASPSHLLVPQGPGQVRPPLQCFLGLNSLPAPRPRRVSCVQPAPCVCARPLWGVRPCGCTGKSLNSAAVLRFCTLTLHRVRGPCQLPSDHLTSRIII